MAAFYARRAEDGARSQAAWSELFERYRVAEPEKAAEFERRMAGELPAGWDNCFPTYSSEVIIIHYIF